MQNKQILSLATRNGHVSRLVQGLYKQPEKVGYLIYLIIGFSAIQSLALHLLGWIPLHTTARLFVMPAFVCGFVLAIFFDELRRLAQHGLFAGIVAVAIYDLARIPFVLYGVWGDFIPDIGNWVLHTENSPAVIGYSWRYIGNGGGMGMAFTMFIAFFDLNSGYTWRGVLFGVFVFLCLVVTLLIAPDGQRLLFRLTPTTFIAGLLGHLIYGCILGMYLDQHLPAPTPG